MTAELGEIDNVLQLEVSDQVQALLSLLAAESPDWQTIDARLGRLRGIFVMVEATAVVHLIDALIQVVEAVAAGRVATAEVQQQSGPVLGLLPRLFRLRPQLSQLPPILFLEEVAALRKLRGQSPLYEYQVLNQLEWPDAARFRGSTELREENIKALKRLKQMFQMGLLELLRDRNRRKGLELTGRAVSRLGELLTSDAETRYWQLVQRVIEGLKARELRLNPVRLRLLSAVERQLTTLVTRGSSNSVYPLGLWRAFMVLLALTPVRDERDSELRQQLGIPALDFSDSDVSRYRQMLFSDLDEVSPNAIDALRERGERLHSLLEVVDSQGELSRRDADTFVRLLSELADLCDQLGLSRAAERCRHHSQALGSSTEEGARLGSQLLRDTAHTVLYLECLVLQVRSHESPSLELLSWLDSREVDAVVEDNLVAAGTYAVWSECLGKLTDAKEQLGDIAREMAGEEQLPELTRVFSDIKGAAIMLGDTRVADIAWRCHDFVRDTLFVDTSPEAASLSRFADAVVGLETHLENARRGTVTAMPLAMADECLTKLGA